MLPGKKDFKYISKEYTELPEVDVKNIEEVLSYSPQLIIAGFYNKNDKNETVFTLGKRLSIPVVLIDLSIDKMDKTYLFLGELFDVDCKPYINFLQTLYKDIDLLKKSKGTVTSSIYYTLGANGLLTDPSGSKHTEVFDFLNIPNAAKVEIPSGGHAQVNLEQVLLWNPDYIFTSAFRGENSAYNLITTDSKWKSIKAVKNNRVYKVPSQPMGWLDHPPSINRVSGMLWLCAIFYGVNSEVTKNKICTFYSLFYKYDLSSTEYSLLFK
jgi:iron complex transport system substrate-binding protein